MIGFQTIRNSLVFTLLLFALSVPSLFAQDSTPKGSILKELQVKATEDGTYSLRVRGILNPKQLIGVRIRQKHNSNKISIEIPSSLVDPEGITNSFLTFGEDLPVENIRIKETTLVKDDDVLNYIVTLDVLTRRPLRAQVVKPIEEGELQIEFKDLSAKTMTGDLPDTPGLQAIKDAREKQTTFTAKRQQELETQKQTASKEVQKDVRMILKSYQKPLVMRVAILNGSGVPKSAYQLSVYLGNIQQKKIEKDLGLKLDIANIANAKIKNVKETTIYYKENYLKSALYLADLVQGHQKVVPMKNQTARIGVDVEIYLGNDYR